MEKYKKLLLIASVIFTVTYLFVKIVIFNGAIVSSVVVLLAIYVFGIVVLLLNKRFAIYLNPNVYPDNNWYRLHLERNYDYIVMGDCSVEIEESKKKLFGNRFMTFSLKNQSLIWDFYILKQYFSILKPGGYVILPITDVSLLNGDADVKDKRPYYGCLRPYFFSRNKHVIVLLQVIRRLPILLIKPKDFLQIIRCAVGYNMLEIYREKKLKNEILFDVTNHKNVNLEKILLELMSFCNQREIIPYFFIKSVNMEATAVCEKILKEHSFNYSLLR